MTDETFQQSNYRKNVIEVMKRTVIELGNEKLNRKLEVSMKFMLRM